MNATILIKVVVGTVVPVGAVLLAVWDARRCRRAHSPPLRPGSALNRADRPSTDMMRERSYQAPMWSSLASAASVRTAGVVKGARDDVPVPQTVWHSAQVRDLLRILTAQQRPIPRKQLIEQLWPEMDPAAASNRLSALLSTSHDAPQTQGHVGPLASDGTLVWLRTQTTIHVEQFPHHAKAALNEPDSKIRGDLPNRVGRC